MDLGLLIARLILGFGLAAHGAQKLFGWFGGYGLKGTTGFFAGLGFRPAKLFVIAAGLGELGGGLLTVLGLFGPLGPALIVLVMLVAVLTVHWPHGFFASANGIEFPLMNSAGALAIAFGGAGNYSLDRVLGLSDLSRPATTWVVVGIGVALALATQAARHRPAPSAVKA